MITSDAKSPMKESFLSLCRGQKWGKTRMYSNPNPLSANIRQRDEERERFKEKRNTVEYERKTGRFGLYRRYLYVSPEIL